MSTVKDIVLSLLGSIQNTIQRADSCYKFVLGLLVALIVASAIMDDYVYSVYGIVLFLLIYNAEYWKQKAEFFQRQLEEKDNNDTSH